MQHVMHRALTTDGIELDDLFGGHEGENELRLLREKHRVDGRARAESTRAVVQRSEERGGHRPRLRHQHAHLHMTATHQIHCLM